jgi:hypothetical protein
LPASATVPEVRRSKAVPLGSGFVALAGVVAATGLVAGCGSGQEREVYCADADGVIADEAECDSPGLYGPRFLWVGPFGPGLRPGHRLSGGTKFTVDDAAARRKYGLPVTGRISNGTVVTKGFGSGGG